jgi:hypothetical protein
MPPGFGNHDELGKLWSNPNYEVNYELVMEQLNLENVLDDLVRSATPGIPFMLLGNKNVDILDETESNRRYLREAVVSSFVRQIRLRDSIFSMTAKELVENGCRDPVRVFIKNEPHTVAKLASGKLRLISGVSVRDQVKERILGGYQNNAEIDSWETCPSRPGIGLNDEGLQVMAGNFMEDLVEGDIMETDVSGYDWSVQAWELDADADARAKLMRANELLTFLLAVQAYTVSLSVFVIPGGEMIAQLERGIQCSGSYWTSSTNSRMRVLATLVARLLMAIPLIGKIGVSAMGDDSTERYIEGLEKYLEKLGHTIKMVKVNSTLEGISFCSHTWNADGLASPDTVAKTMYRYFSHPRNSAEYPEWYAQLAWTIRHCTDRDHLLKLARTRLEHYILM